MIRVGKYAFQTTGEMFVEKDGILITATAYDYLMLIKDLLTIQSMYQNDLDMFLDDLKRFNTDINEMLDVKSILIPGEEFNYVLIIFNMLGHVYQQKGFYNTTPSAAYILLQVKDSEIVGVLSYSDVMLDYNSPYLMSDILFSKNTFNFYGNNMQVYILKQSSFMYFLTEFIKSKELPNKLLLIDFSHRILNNGSWRIGNVSDVTIINRINKELLSKGYKINLIDNFPRTMPVYLFYFMDHSCYVLFSIYPLDIITEGNILLPKRNLSGIAKIDNGDISEIKFSLINNSLAGESVISEIFAGEENLANVIGLDIFSYYLSAFYEAEDFYKTVPMFYRPSFSNFLNTIMEEYVTNRNMKYIKDMVKQYKEKQEVSIGMLVPIGSHHYVIKDGIFSFKAQQGNYTIRTAVNIPYIHHNREVIREQSPIVIPMEDKYLLIRFTPEIQIKGNAFSTSVRAEYKIISGTYNFYQNLISSNRQRYKFLDRFAGTNDKFLLSYYLNTLVEKVSQMSIGEREV